MSAAPNLLPLLTSYVPALIKQRLVTDPTAISTPFSDKFTGAVLFADISGFTRLAETLAEQGPGGAERLTSVLNAYFGQLIDLITANGGDVVKFAGDALLAIWPGPDLALATHRAAYCALRAQTQLRDYRTPDDRPLFLRIAIGAGDIDAIHLGGVFGRWEFITTGTPLIQVGVAEHFASPGQVVVFETVWRNIATVATGTQLPTGHWRVDHIAPPPSIEPIPAFDLLPAAENALRAYIPGAIIHRLAAGQTGWLSELRRLTMLFINLVDIDYNLPLHLAQQLMHDLQTALYRYEGSLNKITIDDKGVTLVAAFGLPPFAHEDDSVRGVLAAIDIKHRLSQLGFQTAIGITTGRAFCGVVGNTTRREYTMIGASVNLAARLMAHAYDAIYCDLLTYESAHSRVDFDALPPVTVKGRTDTVPVYIPVREKRRPLYLKSQDDSIGRDRERGILSKAVQELLRGVSAAILLEGEAGAGKSHLVDDLRRQADRMRVGVFTATADQVERLTPYHAWRNVFSQMFDLSLMEDPDSQRRHLLALLDFEDELVDLAPLLNPVLPFNLPDSELTAQMSSQARADNTRELLLRLLADSVSRSPKIVIIDNAHWLDTASWALLLATVRRLQPALFLIVLRPFTERPCPPNTSICSSNRPPNISSCNPSTATTPSRSSASGWASTACPTPSPI